MGVLGVRFIPAVMSGGSGTRLWPVSRQSFPKQFCEIFGQGLQNSLFAKTVNRIRPFGSPWTVTVGDLKILTEKTLETLEIPRAEIVPQTMYEPRGRNTAPAIAFLCRTLQMRDLADAVVGIFPADQLIQDEMRFQKTVATAIEFAEQGEIVTLGIRPTFPATGYGYIETKDDAVSPSGKPGKRAIRFREKPDEATAKEFLLSGGFYWNAGMFVFKASRMIELLKKHAPGVWQPFDQLKPDLSNIRDVYEKVEAISIDYAVMEKLDSHITVPCEFDWSDVGSWDATSDFVMESLATGDHEDSGGYQTQTAAAIIATSAAIQVESQRNVVFPTDDKSYVFVGVDDIVVVDTQDATLIARRGQSEKVKDAVERLKSSGRRSLDRATQHSFEVRPWGRFEVLKDNGVFKSKMITVDAGAQISYQSHAKRSEHWIIVSGRGEVVLNGETTPVEPGSHVFVPVGAKHRIRNTAKPKVGEPLVFIEVQLGTYFGEDDIIRYEDAYGRV
ncbi:MAG: mannose-1-phosphate guanylyltransferase/mannose-6-phosphate isomerase [Bdellovibrionales bacterium]|jgi:mannose-1-phosphate guanylyltransferase/mannose-1-phosphate guanylyltransferase/mannose-6-phosphate isomerase|nr:mannose-1-phosphate guanylyltransferase/mannose-6-phosphate isomerase [Bdellovibrionales bacterium]